VEEAHLSTHLWMSVIACLRLRSSRCNDPFDQTKQHSPLAPEVQPRSIPKNFIKQPDIDGL
jgi:hypothetical protein